MGPKIYKNENGLIYNCTDIQDFKDEYALKHNDKNKKLIKLFFDLFNRQSIHFKW